MKRTTKYQLGYFEQGDRTSSSIEMQRWETLDVQLYALFYILGNGIISGWNLLASSGLSIVVTPGSGHVNFVSVETTENDTLDGLNPSARNYIYAFLTVDSYWTKNVTFSAFVTTDQNSEGLYLGYVDTDANEVTGINTDGRVYLGFIDTIQDFVKAHRHIGGANNASSINLSTDVQGIINQNNLPDLDASIIQTGTIDQDRLPLIDHISHLINQGTLTHAQLDSFVEALVIQNPTLMGETSTVDLLQLILALKHVYPDIDEYLINEIAYIPGISPDSYVDWDNTTATVDTLPSSEGGTHTITGTASSGKTAYTYTWDSEEEFETSPATYSNVYIDGDQVCLATEESTLVIDEFSDLSQWSVITEDLSSLTLALAKDISTYVVAPNSAKLNVGGTTVEIALVIKKDFDAQDWSGYNKIVFFLKTESVQHGDVYFYLNDNYAGTQSSHVKVLNRNDVTINVDTLQNGWQEIIVDISSYTRTNINSIGFYVSSQEGWDTSKGFDLNIDNIYLTTGSLYKEDGYIRVIFGNNFLYEFWRVRWDAQIPTDSHAAGLVLKSRTRVGNTLADLSTAIWSSYTSVSGTDISLPAPGLYKYIEIEMFFGASTDLTRTAYLKRIYLDYYASDIENSFVYDNDDSWNSGNLFNINVSSNTISISKTGDIDNIIYGTESEVVQLDDNLVDLYNITGSLLPRSTYQVLNDIGPSLGLVTGVSRGNNGNIWVSDIDNDRVIELNQYGQPITGYYGSFITPPQNTYGEEDNGPGSNVTSSAPTTTTTTSTLAIGSKISVLQAIYNSSFGILYIVFDHDLENIYAGDSTFDINKIYLKIGTQKFYLNDSTITLLGVDEIKYNLWNGLAGSSDDSAKFINQFKFTSHVLKIEMDGADKTALNHLVNPGLPSIIISSPCNQQRINSSSVTVNFLLYNFILGVSGSANRIRLNLDGVTQDIYGTSITFSGLASGVHNLSVRLVNADGSLNTNIESICTSIFVSYIGSYSSPYITLETPFPGQIYSASPVVLNFNIENFPILSTGQHIRYIIDSSSPIDIYSEDPINVEDLAAGQHTVTIYAVDKNGDSIVGYPYSSVSGTFIVGLNSLAVTKLYINSGAIQDVNKVITNNTERVYVDVAPIIFENIYSPVDLQVIPCETSIINPSGLPSILIAKLRSQSWLNYLGDSSYATEFINRLAAQANATSTATTSLITNTSSSTLSSIPTAKLIYGTSKYLDGHSVVQLSASTGNLLMSNNSAVFANDKTTAKDLLGSCEKIGNEEIIIGDSINKRAIIIYMNLETGKQQIEWQMDSDRYIPDAHLVIQDVITISIRDDSISEASVFIRQGTNITWENNSSAPIRIVSGTTSPGQWNLDPDLNLYGDQFESPVLQVGDRWSYKFVSVADFNYFIYPSILTGSISVTGNRISSRDCFLVLENDGLSSPFSSRVLKLDCYGNTLLSFGEGYLVKPRDCRPLLSGGFIIST